MTVLQRIPASSANLAGRGFFRINQPALNNGDLFEIDISIKAIVVGPRSDFASYSLWYYNPDVPGSVEEALITADSPWIGQVNADRVGLVPGTNVPGLLYVAPRDLYIPQSLTQGAVANTRIVPPQHDLIFYTSNPPQVPDRRPPYVLRTALYIPNEDNYRFLFPSYGRRTWSVRVTGEFAAPVAFKTGTVAISGVNFTFPTSTIPGNRGTQTEEEIAFIGGIVLGGGSGFGYTHNSEDQTTPAQGGARGYYDFIEVNVNFDAGEVDSNPADFIRGGVSVLFNAHD